MNALVSGLSSAEARQSRSNVVWRRISQRIEERLAVIEQGIAALLSASFSPADAANCRAEASLLSDWLFALDQVIAGRLARDLIDYFDKAPAIEHAAAIATVVDRLRTVVRVAETEWGEVAPGDTRVHFVSGANAQIDAVAWHLQQNGIDITYSPTFFSAPADVDMLVAMTEHPSDALQLLTTIRQRSSTVKRALVHSPKADVRELLRVAPSTELLLRYDATPIDTANHIMMALRPTQRAWSQVVLYGANSLYPELVRNGFSGLIAQDERSMIRMIEEGSPVVVIGPDATQRAELVRLLRCTPATRGATITVCYADEAERERCSRAGANLLIPENYERGTWGEQLRALAAAQDQASGVITDHGAPRAAGH